MYCECEVGVTVARLKHATIWPQVIAYKSTTLVSMPTAGARESPFSHVVCDQHRPSVTAFCIPLPGTAKEGVICRGPHATLHGICQNGELVFQPLHIVIVVVPVKPCFDNLLREHCQVFRALSPAKQGFPFFYPLFQIIPISQGLPELADPIGYIAFEK